VNQNTEGKEKKNEQQNSIFFRCLRYAIYEQDVRLFSFMLRKKKKSTFSAL